MRHELETSDRTRAIDHEHIELLAVALDLVLADHLDHDGLRLETFNPHGGPPVELRPNWAETDGAAKQVL